MVEDTIRRGRRRTYPERGRDSSVEGHSERKVLPSSELSGNGQEGRADIEFEGKLTRIIPFSPHIHDEMFMGRLFKWVSCDPSYKLAFRDGFLDWSEFFRYFDKTLHPERILITIITNTNPVDFAGISWFNVNLPTAWPNFMFRKKYWGTRIPQEGSILSLKYVFQVPGVRVMIGVTPADNNLAINFVRKRLGFHIIKEEIPYGIDADTGSVTSYLTKEMMNG